MIANGTQELLANASQAWKNSHREEKKNSLQILINSFMLRMQKKHRILDQIIWRRWQDIECEATMKEVWITKNGK